MTTIKNLINDKRTAGINIPYWVSSTKPILYTTLNKDVKTDVVVIGGGIAGVTIAYCLIQSGKKVVLLDDGAIGSGETGRTSAHLVNALDDRYYNLEKMYGEAHTKMAAESHTKAIDFIEQAVLTEKIDCEFKRVDGYLFRHPSDSKDALEKEFEAATRVGLKVEMTKTPGMLHDQPCIKFSNQAQFHPLKYLRGLCRAIEKKGGSIFTNTHADTISDKEVSANGKKITADFVVVATNSPINGKYLIHLKQYPFRTYVLGFKIKKGRLPLSLSWDTGDHAADSFIPPYHYVRLQQLDEEYDLLLSGGEDHATGMAEATNTLEEDRYKNLEAWTRKHFPVTNIIYQWSGQVMEPMDSLAYIGRNPNDKDNIFIATGDSGNGLTHGTIAGILITDLINKKPNEWEKLYDPSRLKILTAGKTFFKEFVMGYFAYLKLNPKHPSAIKLAVLQNGEGTIVEWDKKLYGVYRDEANNFHIVNAECTHLQCIIRWNNDEKSWDCPCHGSRFTYEGKVINGPANINLQYTKEKA